MMGESAAMGRWDLRGQSVVVTGSSSGIGRQIAIGFAEAGANLLIHAGHRLDAAEEVAQRVRSHGVHAEVVCADLASAAGQDTLCTRAFQWRDPIDVWVNNAGVDILTGPLAEASFEEKLQQLWSVDVVATMRISRRVGAAMKTAGGGLLLNMGWDQAECGMAGDSGELFAAVKGAVMAASRSLAKSLAPEVRVNCLAPGWIRTQWAESADEFWQQRARKESLLGRWGTTEDVAAMAVFLATPAAQFISGQVVLINGGRR
jgi:3-oxoacyl-[acyl-carrier protein] reductase